MDTLITSLMTTGSTVVVLALCVFALVSPSKFRQLTNRFPGASRQPIPESSPGGNVPWRIAAVIAIIFALGMLAYVLRLRVP